jgi:hypothetical protein
MGRTTAGLLIAAALVLVLAGCGDGGETTTSSAEGESTAPQRATKPAAEKPKGAAALPRPNPKPGSKAAAPGVPVSAEGDNSIQVYGREASDAERAKLSALVHSYLNARAAGEWAEVCTALTAKTRAEQIRFAPGSGNCAEALAFFAKDADPATLRSEAQVEVLSLRIDPRNAFLIYRRPDGVWATALERGGEGWRIVSVTPAVVG